MKPFLLITGMHRSGTSFLARALNLGGVNLGDLESLLSHEWKFYEDNLRGHWENKIIYELTEQTLSNSGGSWHKIPKKINPSKTIEKKIKKHVNELYDLPSLATGFKDPRILICLDAWLKHLPKNFIIVGIFRDPLKVAESLKNRNKFDYEKSISLWKIYNEKLLLYLKKYNGFLLNFDWPKTKLLSEIKLILSKLGLDKDVDLSEWYTDELFHSDKTFKTNYKLPKDAKKIYSWLKKRSNKNRNVRINKISYSKNEISKFLHSILNQTQTQGEYFTKEFKHKEKTIAKLQKKFNERSQWAKKLEDQAKQKDQTVKKLQKEFNERSQWAKKLEDQAKQKDQTVEKLQKEYDERSQWAKKLEDQAKQKDQTVEKLQKEFDESSELAKNLESEAKLKDTKVSHLQKEIIEKKSLLDTQKTELQNLTIAIDTREAELEKILDELSERNYELDEIKKSIIFGILKKITGRLEKDFPQDTKRREALRLAREAYLIKKDRGTKALLAAFKTKQRGNKLLQKKTSIEKKEQKRANLQLLDDKKTKNFVLTASKSQFSPDSSLRKFLQTDSANVTKISSFPKISIIITTLDQVKILQKNLESIKSKTTYKNYEIIIVTNNQEPNSEMRKFLQTLDCSVYVYDKEYSFAGMNNFGASKSTGEFLLFLNDDIEVDSPTWLEAFLSLGLKDKVGAIGGKLVYPDGKLQEAGGIVWKNGNAWNYGRNSDSKDPKFNYVREVDYCSGGCLFVNKKIFEQVGKFDMRYKPAYSEDVDLCFSIRNLGYSVLYQPLARVIHYEGRSQGTNVDKGIKSYQLINQKKFFEKWKKVLESHRDDSIENSFFERNRTDGLNILYIDHYLPEPDKDSGSLRTFNILGILAHDKNKITFWPDNLHLSQPYAAELQQKSIEVIYGPNDFVKFLDERKDLFDVVFLARPYIAIKYIDLIKTKVPNSIIIYDTTDLHYLRMQRESMVEKNKIKENEIKAMHDMELELMEKSNISILTSTAEEKILHEENDSLKFAILPNIHIIKENSTDFHTRKNLMFLGGFQHHPNIDAANYLSKDIFPLIKNKLSDVKLYIVGSNPPESVKNLQSDDVIVTGYVKDISTYLKDCKIMLSPLRYGAGVKGKITQSLSYGLPVITSSMGAEGINFINGENCVISDDTKDFATKTIELYSDEKLWDKLSKNGLKIAQEYSPERARDVLRTMIS